MYQARWAFTFQKNFLSILKFFSFLKTLLQFLLLLLLLVFWPKAGSLCLVRRYSWCLVSWRESYLINTNKLRREHLTRRKQRVGSSNARGAGLFRPLNKLFNPFCKNGFYLYFIWYRKIERYTKTFFGMLNNIFFRLSIMLFCSIFELTNGQVFISGLNSSQVRTLNSNINRKFKFSLLKFELEVRTLV